MAHPDSPDEVVHTETIGEEGDDYRLPGRGALAAAEGVAVLAVELLELVMDNVVWVVLIIDDL